MELSPKNATKKEGKSLYKAQKEKVGTKLSKGQGVGSDYLNVAALK